MASDELIESLRRAVAGSPQDLTLRLHLVELLVAAGLRDEAVATVSLALAQDPTSGDARRLMAEALGGATAAPPTADGAAGRIPETPTSEPPAIAVGDFDWRAAEHDLGSDVAAPFVTTSDDEKLTANAFDVERSAVRLSDVAGLADVKERLELSFLGPARDPELRRLFGKSLSGGLLLYGPPGCGKTFLARALAGELGASFMSLELHDVLDMYVGQSERNLHELFQTARRSSPCVLFIDEVDAIGQRRSQLRNNAMRTTVNQLLSEMDGVGSANDGVYVVGSTNQPWDIDAALRRPGRFDRLLLVPPPDVEARAGVFRYHLRDRPIEAIDPARAASMTEGFSGADIAHVCEEAAESALRDSMRSGKVRMITMSDIDAAIRSNRPSTAPWFETARNVVQFGNESGSFDDLRDYMKRHRLL